MSATSGFLQQTVTGALPNVIETIEVRTRFAPTVILRTKDLLAPSEGPPSPAVRLIKPTIVLRGPGIGEQVIAPAGALGAEDWKGYTLGAILGAAAVGVIFGAVFFRAGVRAEQRKMGI